MKISGFFSLSLKWVLVNEKCHIFDNISIYMGVAMVCKMCTQSC